MPTRTVLVVDASPLSARRVQAALQDTEFSVAAAVDNAQAARAVEGGELAVVLASSNFPGGNGYDLARLVKTRSPQSVVFLLCGEFDVFDPERAEQAGVYSRINRPFAVDSLVRHLEAALGPLARASGAAAEAEPPYGPEPVGAIGDERLASFLPREWRSHPPVRVDPDVVGPALERAILEVLPEVVEVILNKALARSPALRDLIEAAVDDAVRAQIGPIARRVIRERLAEIEASGEDVG